MMPHWPLKGWGDMQCIEVNRVNMTVAPILCTLGEVVEMSCRMGCGGK